METDDGKEKGTTTPIKGGGGSGKGDKGSKSASLSAEDS
jgi:hypothetical protein